MTDTKRFGAVDSLRGFAVLGMAISGMVAKEGLPVWMYHAQSPPPTGETNINLFGITWVDLVFPFFLFALGISVPLSLKRRTDGGMPLLDLLKSLLIRGFNLAAFSVIGTHLRPYSLSNSPSFLTFGISLIAFVCMFCMFLRWPDWVADSTRKWATGVGWLVAILLLTNRTYADGRGFDLARMDTIIMVLANVAISGGLVWYFTREKPIVRLGIMGGIAMMFLARTQPGISNLIWNWHPLPLGYIYQFEYHKYLLIVIPGTMLGDLIMKNQSMPIDPKPREWSSASYAWIAILGILTPLLACAGLCARQINLTGGLFLAVLTVIFLLCRNPTTSTQRNIKGILGWATGLLVSGMLAEPLEGGIRKAAPTMSYYLITTGLACLFLIALIIVHEVWSQEWRISWVVGTGMNPILAYATITHLVMGLEGLFLLGDLVGNLREAMFHGNAWVVVAWGVVKTTLLAYFCYRCTQAKLFLRA